MYDVAAPPRIPATTTRVGRRTRAVRLFHTLPTEGRTSMEVYARELAHAMASAGDDWTIQHYCPAAVLQTACAAIRPLARLSGWADRYGTYQWAVRGHDADVNHIIDHGYGHLVFSLDPRRTVVTFHDAMLLKLEARELATDCYPRITILGHKLSLRAIARVARVIAVSESSRQDFLRFTDYPPERVMVVPQGVSQRFRPPADRGDRQSGPVRILHVGHCGPYKNLETILQALPLIGQRLGESACFVKVGAPFTPSQRALISRLGLESQVQHWGPVPLADLPAAYAAADVLLQPSLYEGFGLTPLEAMACGTPVVASEAGSLPEVVGDAAITVGPTDLEGIADAVARVITDTALRATLRQRGLEQARRFTWERTAQQTLAIYREVDEENR